MNDADTTFWIQAGNPRNLGRKDPADTSVDDAIQTIFPLRTEDVMMFWNYVPIRLGYKYDFGIIFNDVIKLCGELLEDSGEARNMSVSFPSNTFRCDWSIEWNRERVRVFSEFGDVVGGDLKQLSESSVILMPRMEFLSEWKMVLVNIRDALLECGYREDELQGMVRLKEIISRIPGPGLLYRD